MNKGLVIFFSSFIKLRLKIDLRRSYNSVKNKKSKTIDSFFLIITNVTFRGRIKMKKHITKTLNTDNEIFAKTKQTLCRLN